ncbi:Pollen receptor-like kinase 4 [Linum perenne]
MGAHVPGHARTIATTSTSPPPIRTATIIHLVFILSTMLPTPAKSGTLQSDALLKFKVGVGNNPALETWDPMIDPCNGERSNWAGVLCTQGNVWGLQLEHMQLTGIVDVDALSSIDNFRTLSLMDNRLGGPLPEVKKLGKLKSLFLSNNYFSGQIPDGAFEGMGSLKTLYLANNDFSGRIPLSITTLPRVTVIKLDGNEFQGRIPDFQQKFLRVVNLANNELEGPIPKSLTRMNPSSFSGNKGLCGQPLRPCVAPPSGQPSPPPSFFEELKNTNMTLEIIIILLILVIILIIIILALLLYHRRKHAQNLNRMSSSSVTTGGKIKTTNTVNPMDREALDGGGGVGSVHGSVKRPDPNNRLLFLRNGLERFDLQDLLRASAEVLGSGTFGASYKAEVNRQSIVVKRYRHMNNVGREEFHEHMRRLGRLEHPNVLPLEAYYYRKEEKLLVSRYVDNGCLASHLHGNHSSEQGLDWPTRIKIIRGMIKGLAYLYEELPFNVPHAHLKSSNVLLDESMEPLLTDYALRPVINSDHAHKLMLAYKSPEYAQHSQTSDKTDVWCLGIVMLEILTGRFPENYMTHTYDSESDLGTWVNNMVKEKKTSEVFDKDMAGTSKDSKGEMIHLLKLALSCCEEDLERRLEMNEVVEKIDQYLDLDHDSGND